MTLRIASADEDLYGELLALVELGQAKYVGERYDERGVKQIAVDANHRVTAGTREKRPLRVILATPNAPRYGTIRIGREYFTAALRDYEDWEEKWWREAVQNAVDARATEIDCTVTELEGGVEVQAIDNGGGMDEATLLDKFLVLGGTTKRGEAGATGGFGKAKELLLLPWLHWSVQSRGLRVSGVPGEPHEIVETPYFNGTALTVLMAPDQTTTKAAAMAFIGKCHLPKVRFTVNGQSVKADFKSGKHLRDFGDGAAALYLNTKQDKFPARMLVRVNGVYMFALYVSSEVDGTPVLEILKPSVDVMSANRDGFRDRELRHQVSDFVNELAADTKSALQQKKGLIRKRFRGTGKFETRVNQRELEAALLDAEGALIPDGSKGFTSAQLRELVLVLDQVSFRGGAVGGDVLGGPLGSLRQSAADTGPLNFMASGDMATAMLAKIEIRGTTHVEAVVQQLSWEPDFYIVNELEGFRVPRKFFPERMTPRIRQLLHMWAELCRFVLVQLGSRATYGVGFHFAENTGASYLYEDNENWLLLNPYGAIPGNDPRESGAKILNMTEKDTVAWLYAAAVHECTHLADGISYHNESFASAMTRNVARTAAGFKRVAALRKVVTQRNAAPVRAGR